MAMWSSKMLRHGLKTRGSSITMCACNSNHSLILRVGTRFNCPPWFLISCMGTMKPRWWCLQRLMLPMNNNVLLFFFSFWGHPLKTAVARLWLDLQGSRDTWALDFRSLPTKEGIVQIFGSRYSIAYKALAKLRACLLLLDIIHDTQTRFVQDWIPFYLLWGHGVGAIETRYLVPWLWEGTRQGGLGSFRGHFGSDGIPGCLY